MTAELRKLTALLTRAGRFSRWSPPSSSGGRRRARRTGKGADMMPVQLGVGLATNVGAIVLGAWMMGVEYGQKIIRRALSADPIRGACCSPGSSSCSASSRS